MLYELYAENFALLSSVRLQLGEGMNVLTGETGAGKSLIIDALSLLIGGRGSDSMIRSGCDKCIIEGTFLPPFPAPAHTLLEQNSIEASEELILTREIIRGGRSIARINGRTVTLSVLRELGRILVNIHGQREHILLLEEAHQLRMLDSFCVPTHDLLPKVEQAYAQWRIAKEKINDYEANKQQLASRLEELHYIIDELDKADLQPGEEDRLRAEGELLLHSEKLYQASTLSIEALNDSSGAISALSAAANSLKAIASLDNRAEELYRRLNDLFYEAEDMADEVSAYRNSIDMDAYRQEEIEERLALLGKLKKKYSADEAGLIEKLQNARNEAEELAELNISADKLYRQEEMAQAAYDEAADELTAVRQEGADKLAAAITRELSLMHMADACFRIDLPEDPPGAAGREHALFMIRTNTGEPFQSVAKIASGGELSRIILGIKVILSRLDYVPTLIFDEVDTGLSGKALVAVAQRLAAVGENAQTIVVTHNAVTAAAAAHHHFIEKHQEGERTVSSAHLLDDAQREKEIARLIAGDKVGEITFIQARQLLDTMKENSLFQEN